MFSTLPSDYLSERTKGKDESPKVGYKREREKSSVSLSELEHGAWREGVAAFSPSQFLRLDRTDGRTCDAAVAPLSRSPLKQRAIVTQPNTPRPIRERSGERGVVWTTAAFATAVGGHRYMTSTKTLIHGRSLSLCRSSKVHATSTV